MFVFPLKRFAILIEKGKVFYFGPYYLLWFYGFVVKILKPTVINIYLFAGFL